ncbi:hypothetical protein FNW52_16095 [Flavobacterium sp. ZT3R18]|uniref:hypothetical protein n=1 Tax=Flavobacterium sp. ZT3R18 TaxID=2594429 RepID=UPI00117A3F8A|nr:hypothetical protein [Flavobacterium sp. ZT3R18]TRX32978.1 hypothetical protein FNW52_16095 [Flavobacterium sp. ZT3R18]
MEEATYIFNYLPVRYKDTNEDEYIKYLWSSFESNYDNEKYQFAFMAYHMLFMSFVYFNIWQVKSIKEEDFNKIKLGFSDRLDKVTNPFMLSAEGESRIFDLLKYLCSSHSDVNALVGRYKSLVKDRNEIAHANGLIPFRTTKYLESKINDILRYAEEIQSFTKPIIQECFEKFLIESQDEDIRQCYDISTQIEEVLIHQHYLSQKDIEFCLEYDVQKLNEQPNFAEIERIYEALKNEYEIEVA